MTDPMLAARHISHTFTGDVGTLHVLDHVTFSLERDQFVSLVGPSGCGKSTLLRVLAGLIAPRRGEVMLDGRSITGTPHPNVGLIFQQANLMPWRSVLDNVALPLELDGIERGQREAAAMQLIELVGLAGFVKTYPAELSGGMAQRVAIARALIKHPDLLLLDEPFGALDAMTREHLITELLRIWRAAGSTMLMVTHDINEAVLLSDSVIVMSPRPGSIEARFPVDLPRPRTLEMVHTPAAGRLVSAIRSALRL